MGMVNNNKITKENNNDDDKIFKEFLKKNHPIPSLESLQDLEINEKFNIYHKLYLKLAEYSNIIKNYRSDIFKNIITFYKECDYSKIIDEIDNDDDDSSSIESNDSENKLINFSNENDNESENENENKYKFENSTDKSKK